MNRALIRRWINEYLDGEIGLADKAELERLMAEHPEIRAEYKELRQIGLLLGSIPEVVVHPQRFRLLVADAIDDSQRTYFTPQRAFAASMLVVLLVICLSFSLFVYRDSMISSIPPSGPSAEAAAPVQAGYRLNLHTACSAEDFLNRVLIHNQLGMLDSSVLTAIVTQTRVFDGSTCSYSNPLHPVSFSQPLPHSIRLSVSPVNAMQLRQVAEELSGRSLPLTVIGSAGTRVTFEEYLKQSGTSSFTLEVNFR